MQKTKDHTVAGERRRVGLISAERARAHPDRSVLTRSLGRELIAAVDRLSFPVGGGDTLVVCSDGLYNVLEDDEVREAAGGDDPEKACQALIDAANGARHARQRDGGDREDHRSGAGGRRAGPPGAHREVVRRQRRRVNEVHRGQ